MFGLLESAALPDRASVRAVDVGDRILEPLHPLQPCWRCSGQDFIRTARAKGLGERPWSCRPRAPERPAAADHADRDPGRSSGRGSRHHRGRLRLAGHGSPPHRVAGGARLPGRDGELHDHGGPRHPRQPDRRCLLRDCRPTDQARADGTRDRRTLARRDRAAAWLPMHRCRAPGLVLSARRRSGDVSGANPAALVGADGPRAAGRRGAASRRSFPRSIRDAVSTTCWLARPPSTPRHRRRGRDMLSRLIFASQISLSVGVAVPVLIVTIGTVIGAVAGFYGGRVDALLSGLINVALSIPALPARDGPGRLHPGRSPLRDPGPGAARLDRDRPA